jgi:hypothetical protein
MPDEALKRRNEVGTAFELFAYYCMRADKNGFCYPSPELTSQEMGWRLNHTYRYRKVLVKAGWITVKGDDIYILFGFPITGNGKDYGTKSVPNGSRKLSTENVSEVQNPYLVSTDSVPAKYEICTSLHVMEPTHEPTHEPSSLETAANDDEKLAEVRRLFEQLSNGSAWKDSHCLPAYRQISEIGIHHIILGLCYGVTKSPEHRMSSLGYAVESIRKHAADMREFAQQDLIEIAYRTKRITMNCIATGKWAVPEWER